MVGEICERERPSAVASRWGPRFREPELAGSEQCAALFNIRESVYHARRREIGARIIGAVENHPVRREDSAQNSETVLEASVESLVICTDELGGQLGDSTIGVA